MLATERRKWLALALLSAVQFMVVLDIAIVNVALPSIKIDLGFSQENLQWVIGGLILGTATFSLFLMLTLYMQQVLGYSPMKTGVAYLAVAGSAILWSAVAAQLVNRIGVKPVLVTGMVALTSGLVYFTQV